MSFSTIYFYNNVLVFYDSVKLPYFLMNQQEKYHHNKFRLRYKRLNMGCVIWEFDRGKYTHL